MACLRSKSQRRGLARPPAAILHWHTRAFPDTAPHSDYIPHPRQFSPFQPQVHVSVRSSHTPPPVRLRAPSTPAESLPPLPPPATVQGIVHFKSSGRPRLIVAHRISARVAGDAVFESLPAAETIRQEDPSAKTSVKAIRRVDPMALWGAWPGDEPIDELLAQLD